MKKNYFSTLAIYCIAFIAILFGSVSCSYAAPGAITGPTSVCIGSTITLVDTPSGGVWSSSNTSLASIGTGSGIVTGVAAGTVTISYTVSGSTATKIITINPLPANITGPIVVCSGSTIILSDSTTGGSWISSNTAVATVGSASGNVSGLTAGTTFITYRLSTGCQKRMTVSVNPTVPAIGGSTSVCAGSTITLTNSIPDCLWASSNGSIATVGTSGIVTGVAAGTVMISYIVCSSFSTKIVTVNAQPSVPPISAGSGSLCSNATLSLSESTVGGTHTWVSSNTAVATVNAASGLVAGVSGGTTTITYNYTLNGCSNFNTTTITVNAVTVPTITGTTEICINTTTTLTGTPAGGTWATNNASIATVDAGGVVTPLVAVTGTVSYTFTNVFGCTANTTALLIIHGLPTVVGISGTNGVCVNSNITLVDPTPGGVWSSSNTSIGTVDGLGVVTGVSAGVINISYTVTNGFGCVRVRTKATTVNALPAVNALGSTTVCSGHTVILNGTGANSYSWTGGIGDGVPFTPPLIGVNIYTVTGTDAHNCSDTAVAVVTVIPSPVLTTTADTAMCTGSSVVLTADGADFFNWSDSTITNGTMVTPPVGTNIYIITGTATNGCTDIDTVTIVINPLPTVGTTGGGSGCYGTMITLNGTGAATYSWSGGVVDSVAFSPSLGVSCYTVTGTDANGCVNTATAILTVDPVPDAGTISGGLASVHAGSIFTLANTATGGMWSCANPSFAAIDSGSGIITCLAEGVATISYTVTNAGCGPVAATYIVTVTPGSSTPLSPITGTLSVCSGATGTAATASAPGSGWSCSNSSVATINAASGVITGVSEGTAVITFTAFTGAFVTSVVTINASPAPITGGLALCTSSTSALSSTTGGTWTCSNAARATITFTGGVLTGISAGTAIVTNTLATGCRAMAVITVNAQPAAISGVAGLCTGATSALTDATTGGTWSSGAPAVATISGTGVASGISPGIATISYTTANGCSRTLAVTVSALPSIAGPAVMCIGNAATFTAGAMGGTWSSSATAIASAGMTTGIVTALSSGTTNITYTLNAYCKAHTIVSVGTSAAAISGAANVCSGSATTLTSLTSGGTWSSSNMAIASVASASGIVTGVSPGSVAITYALGAGCYQVKNMTVGAGLGTITGSTGLCVGANTIYISTMPSVGLSWTSSNTSVATVGSISGVVTGIAPGTAQITFTPYAFSSYAGCVATKIVTVDAVPTVAPITGPAGVQVGHTITLANATPGGVWSSNNPVRATVSATGVVTGIAVPAAIISYSVTNGACVYAAAKVITVAAAKEAPTDLSGENAISVYPNPSNGRFTICVPVSGAIKIYNMSGEEVIAHAIINGVNAIALPDNVSPGIYLCRFAGDDGSAAVIKLFYKL